MKTIFDLLSGQTTNRQKLYFSVQSTTHEVNDSIETCIKIIRIGLKLNTSSSISFRPNFFDPLSFKLCGYVLYHNDSQSEITQRNWGNQKKFLLEVLGIESVFVRTSFNNSDMVYTLGSHGEILKSHIPDED